MKLKGLDRREIIVTEQEAKALVLDSSLIYKINGNDYYFCTMYKLCTDQYAVRFISCDSVEIEVLETERKA